MTLLNYNKLNILRFKNTLIPNNNLCFLYIYFHILTFFILNLYSFLVLILYFIPISVSLFIQVVAK